jgi:hypothetical protein
MKKTFFATFIITCVLSSSYAQIGCCELVGGTKPGCHQNHTSGSCHDLAKTTKATNKIFTVGNCNCGFKIGDMHPDGGIVYEVTSDRKHGKMIKVIDDETFTHDEAKAKVVTMGSGWQLPVWTDLQKIYTGLHKTKIITFTGLYYWSSWRPSAEFAKYVRFSDGYTSDGPATNKFNICPTKSF